MSTVSAAVTAISRRVRIVGPGRAGRSFADALQRCGWTLAGVLGRHDDVHLAARDVDLLLLAVPDDAIATVSALIDPVDTTVVCHVAGSRTLRDLAPHTNIGSLHPLMSLPDATTGSERLRDGCWFALAGPALLSTVVHDLGGHHFEIAENDRSLYHATAAIAANHLVALCGQVERLAAQTGVPPEAFHQLLHTSLSNATQTSARAALTGPASRGDWTTVQSHVDALPVAEHSVYLALAQAAASLAGQSWPDHLGSPDSDLGTGPEPATPEQSPRTTET